MSAQLLERVGAEGDVPDDSDITGEHVADHVPVEFVEGCAFEDVLKEVDGIIRDVESEIYGPMMPVSAQVAGRLATVVTIGQEGLRL